MFVDIYVKRSAQRRFEYENRLYFNFNYINTMSLRSFYLT